MGYYAQDQKGAIVTKAVRTEDKKVRKYLNKTVILLLFSLIVFILATIAWFVMSKESDTSGMSITVSTRNYDIATKGTAVRNNDVFSLLNPEYSIGVVGIYPDASAHNDMYYASLNTDNLKLMFVPTADDPSTEDIDESIPADVGPDSSGKLSLYVIPKHDGSLSLEFTLNVVGYAYVDLYTLDGNGDKIQEVKNGEPVVDKNGNPVYETERVLMAVSDVSTETCRISEGDLERLTSAEEYLKGHIMFFENESSVPSQYSYSDPIDTRVLSFSENNLTSGTAYPISINWVWANTFGQIALKDNTSGLRGRNIPLVEDSNAASGTDKAAVIEYLKENKASVFHDLEKIASLTEEQKEGKTDSEIEALIESTIDDMIDNADVPLNYNLLSSGYNNADFMIGTGIAYFMIEVTVEEV